jgi:hypothetical protein
MKISAKHTEFIRLVANGTNQSEAYILTNPNKNLTKGTIKVESSKLAKKYADLIAKEKKNIADIITSTKDSEVVQKALNDIVSQAEVDAVVFRIFKPDELVEEIMIIGGKAQVVKRKPTQSELQNAYDKYNKRFGSYAPTQTKIEIQKEQPLFPDAK